MNFENFKWVNESKAEYKDDVLTVYAPSQTDYFNSPVKENGAFPEPVANASSVRLPNGKDFFTAADDSPAAR